MKKTEMIKIWRRRLKEELEDLSFLEFQKEVWIDKNKNFVWEWNEACATYFDDLGLSEKKESKFEDEGLNGRYKMGFLSYKEVKILKPFNKKLAEYFDKTPNYPTDDEYRRILLDPEWIRITEMAKDILTKIDFGTLPDDQK